MVHQSLGGIASTSLRVVSLDWLARLENRIPLRLVISGQILRSGDGQAVMTIDKYEFRVRGTEPSAVTASEGIAIEA
jgi:hypothetical protein